MSDTHTEDEHTDEGPEFVKRLRKEHSQMKKDLAEAQSRLEAIDRGKVFDDAGVPAEKTGALFREAYKGDLTAEAVKAKAIEYGLIEPETPTPSVPAEELAAHQRSAETVGVVEPPPDALAKIAAATTPEELDAALATIPA
jgi:hypothetical protein